MASFKFRFERLLQLKIRQEERRKEALATCLHAEEEARRAVQEARARLAAVEDGVRRMRSGPFSLAEMLVHTEYLHVLRRHVHHLEEALQNARAESDAARQALIDATIERRTYAKLKERAAKGFQAKEARVEQFVLDEIAQRARGVAQSFAPEHQGGR